MSAFLDRIKALKFAVYDFTGAESLGANDCEFVDGFHGGEIVYQRILAEIARRKPHGAIAPIVSRVGLNNSVQQSSGHTLSAESAATYVLDETDFLAIGCAK